MGTRERKERQREELRRLILETAAEIVSQEGMAHLSIRRLAERIEYSPRTIYLYFTDKEDLLRQMVEGAFGETLARLEGLTGPAPENPIAAGALMEGMLRRHIVNGLSSPRLYRTIIGVLQAPGFEPGPNQRKVEEFLQGTLIRSLAAPSPDPVRVDDGSRMVFALLRGFTIGLIAEGENCSEPCRERRIEEFIRFIRSGLGALEEKE